MADLQKMRSVTARDAEEEAQMTRYGDIYTLSTKARYIKISTNSYIFTISTHSWIYTNIYTRLKKYLPLSTHVHISANI